MPAVAERCKVCRDTFIEKCKFCACKIHGNACGNCMPTHNATIMDCICEK